MELRLNSTSRQKQSQSFTKLGLKSRISEKLNLLESQGIIEKVHYSEWAAPIVAVDKPDGGVRIFGDFKVTVIPELEVDKYPLSRVLMKYSQILLVAKSSQS